MGKQVTKWAYRVAMSSACVAVIARSTVHFLGSGGAEVFPCFAVHFIAIGVNRPTFINVIVSSGELSPRCSISASIIPIPRTMSAHTATPLCANMTETSSTTVISEQGGKENQHDNDERFCPACNASDGSFGFDIG